MSARSRMRSMRPSAELLDQLGRYFARGGKTVRPLELRNRLLGRSALDAIRLEREAEFDQRGLRRDRQMRPVLGVAAAQKLADRVIRSRRRNRDPVAGGAEANRTGRGP